MQRLPSQHARYRGQQTGSKRAGEIPGERTRNTPATAASKLGQAPQRPAACRRRVAATKVRSSQTGFPPCVRRHGHWQQGRNPDRLISCGTASCWTLQACAPAEQQPQRPWRPGPDQRISCSGRSCRSINARANSASRRPCSGLGAFPRSPGPHTKGLQAPARWRRQ